MKTVNFVKSLVIEQVPMVSDGQVRYSGHIRQASWISPDFTHALLAEEERPERIVSITHISHAEKIPEHELPAGAIEGLDDIRVKDTYIAYSKEVQEFLGMPFDVLNENLKERDSIILNLDLELQRADERLEKYKTATLWQRIKYLFGGEL